MKQLKLLYKNIEKEKVFISGGIADTFKNLASAWWFGGQKRTEPNPLYPDEEYEEFISRLITAKKNKIERVLDLY